MPAAIEVIPKLCSLYKQPRSDKWYARIKLTDGNWHRVSTNLADIDAAKKRAMELYFETQVKYKNNLPQNSRSFSSVAQSIVKKLEDMRNTAEWKQTYQAYIYAINKYQIPYFGSCKLDNLKGKYEGYVSYVGKEIGKNPAESTLNNHHSALRLILNEAVERGWANNSTLPVIKSIGAKSQRRPSFELTEYKSLIEQLRHWRETPTHRKKDAEIKLMLYDYVLTLASSGIRHGREALEIKWSNISFMKSPQGNEVVGINVVKRKGRKGTEEKRTVIVRHNEISDFKKILTRIKNRNNKLSAKTLQDIIKQRVNEPLFVLSDGTQPDLSSTFQRFLEHANLKIGAEGTARTLYSLRHFYATQELGRAEPLAIHILAQQMGTSVKMIEKHYGHMNIMQKADRLSGYKKI